MKSRKLSLVLMLVVLSLFAGCGGSGSGDGGGSSTGTVSMSITDAKPALPEGITHFFVTIDEVLVHKSGGAWVSLPLPKSPSPYTIDLLQFSDGNTTELVPPVKLESGKYTQIRLAVGSAMLVTDSNSYTVTIPSENLKTDKNFDFDVTERTAVDITVDFDLSKSIVVEGPAVSPSYKLKPVLHIVETAEAATIEGTIKNSSIPDSVSYAEITVFVKSTGEEYTKVKVDKNTAVDASGNPPEETAYSIFWLVPNQAYTVGINYNPGKDDDPTTVVIEDNIDESVDVPSDPNDVLQPGEIYPLNFPQTT